MKRKLVFLAVLVVFATGPAACGGAAQKEPVAQTGYTPTFEPGTCPFELPSGQVEGQTVECGYLVVPEDRSDPDNRSLRIAVAIFHPAGGATEPDPIIYLVGGPGASALELLYLSFDEVFRPVFAVGRDLILFDQRGVGLSEPALDCPAAYELDLELLDENQDGERLTHEAMDELVAKAFKACAQDLRAVADLSAYNTAASAADVNDLRIALGYDQVNLWGGSYGTRLALDVMRDYPQGLRSVVLSSTYPPDVDIYLEAPANLDRALDLLFDSCTADAACNAAFPELRRVFFGTLAAMEANPVEAAVTNPLTGESHNVLLTGDAMFGFVFQLLYETQMLPVLPQLIYDASQGDFDTINRLSGAMLAQATVTSRGMMFSVQCNEELPFSSSEQSEAALLDYPDLAPFMRDTMVGPAILLGDPYQVCTYWGAGQADPIENEPVSSDIPTLVMQGEHDPITPPAWGEHAAETLSNGYVYVYPGVAHGASVMAGCPREMLLAFIQDPTAAPDDACIAGMGGLAFSVPGAGGEVVEMVPFTSEEKGIQGAVPAGWTEAASGTYVRGSSAVDGTTLVVDAVPMASVDLFRLLAEQIGFAPDLEPVSREELDRFTWDLYESELQGLALDLALAEADGVTYMVLLAAQPEEHDALYEQVFWPAVDALAPLE